MLKERLNSFKYAFKGILDLFRSETNARIHLAAAFFTVGAGFFFQVSSTEWCLLILCIALVFSAEAINTAIEHLTDLVSPEFHPLAGRTKDVAAAAVLFLAIAAMLIAAIIFVPRFILLIGAG